MALFEKLIKNLEFYSALKSKNLLNALDFVFVVYSENYTEIPAFVEFAKKSSEELEKVSNNIKEFKFAIENNYENIFDYVIDIKYNYNVKLELYDKENYQKISKTFGLLNVF